MYAASSPKNTMVMILFCRLVSDVPSKPPAITAKRITHWISLCDALGLRRVTYMLEVKMEENESKAESADDITAAAMAPVPMIEIAIGGRCWSVIGRIIGASPRSSGDGDP